jgi:hypothetical protein
VVSHVVDLDSLSVQYRAEPFQSIILLFTMVGCCLEQFFKLLGPGDPEVGSLSLKMFA